MRCERCGKEHDGRFGSGRFCNKSCANARVHSDITKAKIRKTLSDKFEKVYCSVCGKQVGYNNKTKLCVKIYLLWFQKRGNLYLWKEII